MKLYNTIAIFDVFVVAESSDKAREALLMHIAENMKPGEIVGIEVTREQAIRASWCDEKPLVGADVSDADFAKLKGKTTIEIFREAYTKG